MLFYGCLTRYVLPLDVFYGHALRKLRFLGLGHRSATLLRLAAGYPAFALSLVRSSRLFHLSPLRFLAYVVRVRNYH